MKDWYWAEKSVPDTKITRKLYKNNILQEVGYDKTLIVRYKQEMGVFTAPSSGSYELRYSITMVLKGGQKRYFSGKNYMSLKKGDSERLTYNVHHDTVDSYITDYSVIKVY